MPGQEKPLWTTGRKLVGNLMPLIVVVPFLVLGTKEALEKGLTPTLALWLFLLLFCGWLTVGLLGLPFNRFFKKEMALRLHKQHPFDPRPKFFVGFARPAFKGLLDAHEDIGFVMLGDEEIEFVGEHRHFKMQKSAITRIRYRTNPHTWLLLGRWVSVEGTNDGHEVRMLLEPREKATLFGNFIFSARLSDRLNMWLKETPKLETAEPSALKTPPRSE